MQVLEPIAMLLLTGLLAPLGRGEEPSAPSPGPAPAVSPAPAPTPTLTLGGLTTNVMQSIHEDGTADAQDLEAMLRVINQEVQAHLILHPDRNQEGVAALGEAPLTGSGWRLWVFWSVDVPDCAGLPSALIQVRASNLATVRPVHLCSLRRWEGWMHRMNTYREAELAAARRQDVGACRDIFRTWKAEVTPFDDMISAFYNRGVSIMGDARSAVTLHVDAVPSFRLVSPEHRVHALSGFGPGFDLVAWITNCQAWEAQEDERRQREGR